MNEYIERTNRERDKALSADGYNIVPTTSEPYPEVNPESAPRVRNIPPFAPAAKPRPFRLFFCGLNWSVIAGFAVFCTPKNNDAIAWTLGALMLALTLAALGLVWGVFQHVLKTIVQIVRRA